MWLVVVADSLLNRQRIETTFRLAIFFKCQRAKLLRTERVKLENSILYFFAIYFTLFFEVIEPRATV